MPMPATAPSGQTTKTGVPSRTWDANRRPGSPPRWALSTPCSAARPGRCTETVAPIAAASGVDIVEMEELREVTYVTEHEGWSAWQHDLPWAYVVGAAGVGRVARAVEIIAARVPAGRVAVCAHGDLVPAFAAFAAAYLATPVPDPIARGGCYQIDLAGTYAAVSACGALLRDRG